MISGEHTTSHLNWCAILLHPQDGILLGPKFGSCCWLSNEKYNQPASQHPLTQWPVQGVGPRLVRPWRFDQSILFEMVDIQNKKLWNQQQTCFSPVQILAYYHSAFWQGSCVFSTIYHNPFDWYSMVYVIVICHFPCKYCRSLTSYTGHISLSFGKNWVHWRFNILATFIYLVLINQRFVNIFLFELRSPFV